MSDPKCETCLFKASDSLCHFPDKEIHYDDWRGRTQADGLRNGYCNDYQVNRYLKKWWEFWRMK